MAEGVTSNVKIIVFFTDIHRVNRYPDDDNFASYFLLRRYDNVKRISFKNIDQFKLGEKIKKARKSNKKVTFVISDVTYSSPEYINFFRRAGAILIRIYGSRIYRRDNYYPYEYYYDDSDFDALLYFTDYFEFCSNLSDIHEKLERGKKISGIFKRTIVNEEDSELVESCLRYFETIDNKSKQLNKRYSLYVTPLCQRRTDMTISLLHFAYRNIETEKEEIPPILLNIYLSRFLSTQRGFTLWDKGICFMGRDIRGSYYDTSYYRTDHCKEEDIKAYFYFSEKSFLNVFYLISNYFLSDKQISFEGEFETRYIEIRENNIDTKINEENTIIEFLHNITQTLVSMANSGLLIRYPSLPSY